MMSSVELHITFDKALFLTLVVKAKALTELPQKPRLTLLGMRQTPKPTVLTRNTHTSTPRFCGAPAAFCLSGSRTYVCGR